MTDYTYRGYQTTDTHIGDIKLPELDVDKRVYPNWIITDVRFPNEVKAIKDKGGIVIRVDRHNHPNEPYPSTHESEIALDNYNNFDYYLINNGTIEDLIQKVRSILISQKIIS